MTTPEMEIALARFFDPRRSLIVPNISWSMFRHECDLLIVTKAGYAYEVEIKVSRADMKQDELKSHHHESKIISRLYFAIPKALLKHIDLIPGNAGIISVGLNAHCMIIREAPKNNGYKFTDQQRYDVARLATMRIWGLKQTIERYKQRGNK